MMAFQPESSAFHFGPDLSDGSSPRHGSTSLSQLVSDEERNPFLPENFEEYITINEDLDRPLLLKCLLEHAEREYGRERVIRPRLGVEFQADLRGLSGDGTISSL